ncbi:MAG: YkgJ family cysteine cluster protein [Candidatus Brocadiia bacterium]
MPRLILPPGVRYACMRCGACCRSLEVTVTDAERERLLAHDWSDELGDVAPERLFARIRGGRGLQRWRLRPRPEGACPFLGEDALCRVHAELGYEAKPFAGRLFPFTFAFTPVGVFVGCRFSCPAVVRGKGPPLEAQRGEIERLRREYVGIYSPRPEPERVRFFGRYELSWHDVLRLEDQLVAFLGIDELSVARRLLACRRLVRRFVGLALTREEGTRVGVEPEAIVEEVRLERLEAKPLSSMERVLLRLLTATFLGAELPSFRERPRGRRLVTRLGKLGGRMELAVGRGRLRLPGVDAAVPVGETAAVDCAAIDAPSAGMLERYFAAKVASQGFFGRSFFGRSFVSGMDFLACVYGTIVWVAAAHAVAGGRRDLGADDVAYAIRQVDYGFNYIGAFGGRVERMRAALFWQWDTPEKLLVALSRGG